MNQKFVIFFLFCSFFNFFEGTPVFVKGAPMPWHNGTMASPNLIKLSVQ